MRISVIGHGNVGSALIKRWARAGHEIIIGARNPEDEAVKQLTAKNANVSAQTITDCVTASDTIVVAIPAHLTAELANTLGNLQYKIVIDTTNAVFKRPEPYRTGFEAFQKITGAEVVKCFNSTGFENMNEPAYTISTPSPHQVKLDMFAAGSSQKAKQMALQLAEDAGFEAYDFGGDDKVELLEELCRIWINLAMGQGLGRNIGFKLMKR